MIPAIANAAVNNGFVVAMGIGTVFVGLICIILLIKLMSMVTALFTANAPAQSAPAAPAAPAPVAAAPVEAEAEYKDVKFSGIRRAISKSMTTSLHTMAQLTHNTSFDASAILAYRKEL